MFKSDYCILDKDSPISMSEVLNKFCQQESGYSDVGVRSPANRKRTLQFLNQGHFHELLMLFANAGQYEFGYDKGEWVVVLSAYSMKLGAVIEKDDLMIIRSALQHTEIDAEVKKQMEKALNEYKSNGEGWDFESSSIGSESNPGRSVPIEEMEERDKSGELGISRRGISQLSEELRNCRELLENVSALFQQDLEQVNRGSGDQKDVDEGEACMKK